MFYPGRQNEACEKGKQRSNELAKQALVVVSQKVTFTCPVKTKSRAQSFAKCLLWMMFFWDGPSSQEVYPGKDSSFKDIM